MVNNWLINNAQNILHEKFPLVEGLEDTIIGPMYMLVLTGVSLHRFCRTGNVVG